MIGKDGTLLNIAGASRKAEIVKKIRQGISLVLVSTLLLAPLAYAQVTQTEVQKLLADDAETDDVFGSSVAIDGHTAVIGAPRRRGAARIGAAYVFTQSAGTWTLSLSLQGKN